DNAATTKLDPRVYKKMKQYFLNDYANASSIHYMGEKVFNDMEDARKRIASLLNCDPNGIIFTSSATESNNFIIKGVARANKDKGNHILVSAIEHHCVLSAAEQLEKEGFVVEKIPVNKDGIIILSELEKMIKDETILVSTMFVNNEIGTIQPIKEISEIVHKKGKLLHVDAVQAVPYLNIDINGLGIDFLSLSAHKFYGPKGVGLAYINKAIKIEPLIVGGGQEKNLRSGTYNTPGIIGMAYAIELAYNTRDEYLKHVTELRDYMWDRIKSEIPDVYLNGSFNKRTPNNLNVGFKGIEGEAILMMLSTKGICVSTASACGAQNLEVSHVISAIKLDDQNVNSNIRITMGRFNTKKEIEYFVDTLKMVVKELRERSPLTKNIKTEKSFSC
ncbi:MAG TPA: cysteine desulfurase family protein, partial [bacterium]|nr:cysteine desulfurase family protein [bacterium]